MKQQKVRNAFMTLWMDDGTETPFAAGLLPLILFAEEGFTEEPEDAAIDEKLHLFQEASMEEWMLLTKLDCLPGCDR